MIKWFKRKNKNESGRDERQSGAAAEAAERVETIEEESLLVSEPAQAGESSTDVHSGPETEPTEHHAPEDEAQSPEETEDPIELVELAIPEEPGAPPPGGFFGRMRDRLRKTREQFTERVDRVVRGRKTIDMDLLDELEEVLVTSDLGVPVSQMLLEQVADKVKRRELSDPKRLRTEIRDRIRDILAVEAPPFDPSRAKPFVVMVIGVNGVGKTTTIAKLAHLHKQQGYRVLLGAGDTFRAAAVEQLRLWGERAGVPVVHQKSGSDPSAVAFDTLDAAFARGSEMAILDTAGRMHTKANLMEELKKIRRVIGKKNPEAPHETLLVLDATTGQNALSQARMFKNEMNVTGLVLTKLDGTAKGGIIVPICHELQVPVRYIGIGEGMEDLRPFDPDEFTRALF